MKHLQTFENFDLLDDNFLNEKEFYRIPRKVIDNDFYLLNKKLNSIYQSLEKGNDLDINAFDNIILNLKNIRKLAERFTNYEDIKGTEFE